MDRYTTGEVFVPVGMPSLTFIQRPALDHSFRAWRGNKSKHLLIFGASKSGKTSLWKKYISDNSKIKIACNSKKNLSEVYDEIIDQLNIFFTSEKGHEIGTKLNLLSEFKAIFGLGSASVRGEASFQENRKDKEEKLVKPVVSAGSIAKFLKPAEKIVILEDFHYANDEFKQLLSQDLKSFSDDENQWIIVGIQHKTSELLAYNEDLHQRIAEIPVEGFLNSELEEIIDLDCLALNIEFSPEIKKEIIKQSYNSASLVQNICQRICLIENIDETQEKTRALNNLSIVSLACREIAREERSFYEKVIKNVSQGGRSDGSTEKYKWFLKLIRDIDIPEAGLKNTEIHKHLISLGHNNIEQSSVTAGLSYLPKLLIKLSFPSFFDYDEDTKTFFLLDKYMKFVFRWNPDLVDKLFET